MCELTCNGCQVSKALDARRTYRFDSGSHSMKDKLKQADEIQELMHQTRVRCMAIHMELAVNQIMLSRNIGSTNEFRNYDWMDVAEIVIANE